MYLSLSSGDQGSGTALPLPEEGAPQISSQLPPDSSLSPLPPPHALALLPRLPLRRHSLSVGWIKMMLLKQQNWEQWQGAGISSGNWGACQEAFSPAGGHSAPTPHLSYKHTQIAPPLLQYSGQILQNSWPSLDSPVPCPLLPPQSPIPESVGSGVPA